MSTATSSLTSDHPSEHTQVSVVPRPIVASSGIPVVVILIPEVNDPMFADLWQFSFDKLASKFEVVGVRAMAAPWLTTPLSSDSLHSFIYIACLAWGYHHRTNQWNEWLRSWPKEVKLINSPSLILWNTRKTYLQDIQKAGLPVIPTLYVEHIDEKTLINAATHFATSDLIVKPQVSACGFNMVRVLVDNTDFTSAPRALSTSAAIAELTRLDVDNSMMMIQPFMSSVVQEGEISVFVFDGKVGHAVRSNTQSNDYRVQFEHGGITTALEEISIEMLNLVHAVITVCPEIPVYARVDMIRDTTTGHLCVIELELIEPNLYLEHAPDEGIAFVNAVLQVISRKSS